MSHPDPDELMIAATYSYRTPLFAWRPDTPGVRVVVAPAGDGPDVVVEIEQDRDTDTRPRILRRLALRLPTSDW